MLDTVTGRADTGGADSTTLRPSGGRQDTADSSGARPALETPEQRHARRVAWGKQWGAVGKAIGETIRAMGD